MKILFTGAAGFIGGAVCRRLLNKSYDVVVLDNINDYYDPTMKYGRLAGRGIAKEEVAWYKFTPSATKERIRR